MLSSHYVKIEEEIQNVTDEIIDRFVNISKEVENLLKIARIKKSVIFTFEAMGIINEKSQNKNVNNIAKTNKDNKEENKTERKDLINIDIVKLIKQYGKKIKFQSGEKQRITSKENEIVKHIKNERQKV